MVTCRRQTLLPLDDGLYAWPATIPHLTRAALHRCLTRHGISRVPALEGDTPQKKQFTRDPIGYFQSDMAEVRTAAGQRCLCVAIDRAGKFAYAERHADANTLVAAQFLRNLMAALPDTIHTVLTDHGIQVTTRTRDMYAFHHLFDRVCHEHGLDHRLPSPTIPGPMAQSNG